MLFNSKRKELFKQIDAAFIELKNDCPSVVWDEMAAKANSMIKARSDAVTFFEKYPYSPRVWVITFSSNYSGNVVESGAECVYRGVLSMKGEEYLKVFEYTTLKLAKEGIISEAEANKNIRIVKENLQTVG